VDRLGGRAVRLAMVAGVPRVALARGRGLGRRAVARGIGAVVGLPPFDVRTG
jgi:hypothetical protein